MSKNCFTYLVKRQVLADLLLGAELSFGLVHRWMRVEHDPGSTAHEAALAALPPEFQALVRHTAVQMKALLDKYGEDAVDAAMDDIDWMIDEHFDVREEA